MRSSGTQTSNAASPAFPNTRWSVVLAARQGTAAGAADALETLCRSYWFPLYAYVRRCGHSPPDAQDLTQEFFARLLEKRWLESADRDKGRLRTFLIVALRRFIAKEWRRLSAQRRGGGRSPLIPIDSAFAESHFAADGNALPPDQLFDQQWALTLIRLTLDRLKSELEAAGRPDDFELLKGCLMSARGGIDYGEIATRLGMSEGAARVAVHRLRKRFREIYRAEVIQTLSGNADLDEELRALASALGGKSAAPV